MDAIDILGGLLGRRSQSGSSSGNILRDMLGGKRPTPATQTKSHPKAQRPRTIEGAAQSLEEMLGVGHQHHETKRGRQPAPTQRPPTSPPSRSSTPTPSASSIFPDPTPAMNEQAKTLVRAMLSAAKSDGQVTEDEQQAIMKQLGDVSQEEIDFLRDEFAKPVDVRELAWNVPLGMEEQVYTVSLLSIELNEQSEANYLAELAHGLRLDPKRCNDLHRNYHAPTIFNA